jgi:hypothetical protein
VSIDRIGSGGRSDDLDGFVRDVSVTVAARAAADGEVSPFAGMLRGPSEMNPPKPPVDPPPSLSYPPPQPFDLDEWNLRAARLRRAEQEGLARAVPPVAPVLEPAAVTHHRALTWWQRLFGLGGSL